MEKGFVCQLNKGNLDALIKSRKCCKTRSPIKALGDDRVEALVDDKAEARGDDKKQEHSGDNNGQ
ncbi:MAG: hypothetical protein WCK00_10965 [Deltaproteobacteria bacterium]